ncbi:MAG: hypothetical protein LUD00_07800 [Prevotellaceae bacterium]|nr:hypothetical protein [Prevotellaceae bacterium]
MESRTNEKDYWLHLSERYFEAETTDEEEGMLKSFLLSEAGRDSEFDELRAVMGFVAVGRRMNRKDASAHRRFFGRTVAVYAAAAACVLFMLVFVPIRVAEPDEICVAYISGEKITNVDKVMLEMRDSWLNVQSDKDVPTIEQQLSGMFATMEEAE